MALASFAANYDRESSNSLNSAITQRAASVTSSDWRKALPVLEGAGVTLRELRLADAPALLKLLTTEEVTRFISPPPTTVEGFERFIHWANAQRAAGQYLCFAVVPQGGDTAVGLVQLRSLRSGFGTAEWGFAIGQPFWGTGLFATSAQLILAFAFEVVGVHRLEARAVTANGRGNGALQKAGARREATLRRSFRLGGRKFDQALWTILKADWLRTKAVWGSDTPLIGRAAGTVVH